MVLVPSVMQGAGTDQLVAAPLGRIRSFPPSASRSWCPPGRAPIEDRPAASRFGRSRRRRGQVDYWDFSRVNPGGEVANWLVLPAWSSVSPIGAVGGRTSQASPVQARSIHKCSPLLSENAVNQAEKPRGCGLVDYGGVGVRFGLPDCQIDPLLIADVDQIGSPEATGPIG